MRMKLPGLSPVELPGWWVPQVTSCSAQFRFSDLSSVGLLLPWPPGTAGKRNDLASSKGV